MSFCISRNCFTRRLTSGKVVPEPAAMRRRRELLRTFGSRRSARGHRPDDRFGALEVAAIDGGLGLAGQLPMPGIMPMT